MCGKGLNDNGTISTEILADKLLKEHQGLKNSSSVSYPKKRGTLTKITLDEPFQVENAEIDRIVADWCTNWLSIWLTICLSKT